jgi:hypothetical protein
MSVVLKSKNNDEYCLSYKGEEMELTLNCAGIGATYVGPLIHRPNSRFIEKIVGKSGRTVCVTKEQFKKIVAEEIKYSKKLLHNYKKNNEKNNKAFSLEINLGYLEKMQKNLQ